MYFRLRYNSSTEPLTRRVWLDEFPFSIVCHIKLKNDNNILQLQFLKTYFQIKNFCYLKEGQSISIC